MVLPPPDSVKTEGLDPDARICGEIVFVHPTRRALGSATSS
jgi:hypothetical protein